MGSDSSNTVKEVKSVQSLREATVLFAGDSGDGMQLTGSQFTLATAFAHNDLSTLPDFPAEIRAPAGTTYGVSGYQLHFGSVSVRTPGDEVDLLVAMNPAALKVNLSRVRSGGAIVINENAFKPHNLKLAGYGDVNPLDNEELLRGYQVFKVELSRMTEEALKDHNLDKKVIDRSKNMFALGLALWLYSRPIEPALDWLAQKFSSRPELIKANQHVLKKGFHYGETTEDFIVQYQIPPAELEPGVYRAIRGVESLALGLVAASTKSKLPLFYSSYPITPASDLLHNLSRHKNFGVKTFQAEDEIAAIGATIGASFGGCLGVCATSGPGLTLKAEGIGLAVMMELPMVIVNVQRGGPSTGLPTKTEQSDLLQAMYGRNGEAPLPIIAASTPGDCFHAAYEACRVAVRHMTPVILLADGYVANGSEPWRIPSSKDLKDFHVPFANKPNRKVEGKDTFLPYLRNEDTLARPWAKPGTPGLEHRLGGLEKEHETGSVSYDPENHQFMTTLRANKVKKVAQILPPLDVYGDTEGDLVIIGWGSTQGAIRTAVDRLRDGGLKAGAVQLRNINPLPSDLGSVLSRFDHYLVPELNMGQLVRILRDRFLLPFVKLSKVQGQPFKASEIVDAAILHCKQSS
ncbi:MAG: 2-oxoacid:acceptor oxidoreductase subunit alpha [Bacteroidetes bacterium]|nr:2-oxoacid:acceptor oxidoreductase subunit alpha [Bacteroidota bacterium]MCY4204450.1 2-oxoacid:acceptor oxidoreductase subunit alpha [Bacteroidota bacterium]